MSEDPGRGRTKKEAWCVNGDRLMRADNDGAVHRRWASEERPRAVAWASTTGGFGVMKETATQLGS
jgi:hypothetical protein